MSTRTPHVALLIETSSSYGRGLLRGVRRYIAEHGPWSVFLERRSLRSGAPPWLEGWHGDGILTRTGSQEMADAVAAAGVPTLELRATRLQHDNPFVGVDNSALGRLVAEHLMDCGFRNFGCYALSSEAFFEERCNNFIDTVRDAGCPCAVYNAGSSRETPAQWEREQEALAAWLTAQPKPFGIMACNDQLGFWLLDACKRANLAVPEQVAVVGVENDESLCEMTSPPMSSVWFNAERIGYEASAILDAMMRGEPPPPCSTVFAPGGIIVRQSSDIVAVNDELVARALEYIRRFACTGTGVNDVVLAVHTSRSVLERRFRSELGRTLKAEINRVRLRRVRELLSDTDLSLVQVADRTGFDHPQYMAELFKRTFEITPGEYRKAFTGRQQVFD